MQGSHIGFDSLSKEMNDLTQHRYFGKAPRNTILGTHSMGIGYVILMIILLLWLEFFEVIPSLFRDSMQLFTTNFLVFLYIMINVTGNYYYLVTTDTSYKKVETCNEERDGYFYCQSCEQNSPPRSHHCSFCDRCIVRRDHHCIFTASCLGHANYRFFIVFNLFVFVGSAYVVIINLYYLHINIGPLIPLSFEAICKVIPLLTVFKLWTGSVTLYYFLVVCVTWLCLIQAFGCFGCFVFQMTLIFSGQTTYEWQHNIFIYDEGWKKNFQDICGPLWYLWWLFPFFQLQKLASNEEDYYTQYTSKSSKYV